MASKLAIYNDALNICGERKIANLSVEEAPRRRCDTAWDNELLLTILEDFDWVCHSKLIHSTYDSAIEPAFGYQRGHPLPSDHGRTAGVYSDEYAKSPWRNYHPEGNVLYCDLDDLYIEYVPDAAAVEATISSWPGYFARHVAGFLAKDISKAVKGEDGYQSVMDEYTRRKLDAETKDAQRRPAKRISPGNWALARTGYVSRWRDR